jgi:hypothetical protein
MITITQPEPTSQSTVIGGLPKGTSGKQAKQAEPDIHPQVSARFVTLSLTQLFAGGPAGNITTPPSAGSANVAVLNVDPEPSQTVEDVPLIKRLLAVLFRTTRSNPCEKLQVKDAKNNKEVIKNFIYMFWLIKVEVT